MYKWFKSFYNVVPRNDRRDGGYFRLFLSSFFHAITLLLIAVLFICVVTVLEKISALIVLIVSLLVLESFLSFVVECFKRILKKTDNYRWRKKVNYLWVLLVYGNPARKQTIKDFCVGDFLLDEDCIKHFTEDEWNDIIESRKF